MTYVPHTLLLFPLAMLFTAKRMYVNEASSGFEPESPVHFEPAIPARKQPQTYALDGAATGIGGINEYKTRLKTGFLLQDMKAFRGVEERLHSFFISTHDRHEWSLSPLFS